MSKRVSWRMELFYFARIMYSLFRNNHFAEKLIAMKRKIEQKLIDWKNSINHMPLIVNGARQIGKTYSVLEFGMKNYQNVVHINLEKNKLAAMEFEGDLSPSTLVLKLESLTNERILPEKTLLFLDEIQASERALTSLKYFCEDAPEYHVVAAGSLLGVAVNRSNYSFPVGKVDELNMYSFGFEEFLWDLGRDMFDEEIKKNFAEAKAMSASLHKLRLEFFYQFLI